MARVLRYLPALAVVCACSHDWDSLDPRLGSGGVPGTGSTGGGAGAGNSGGTAGTVSGGGSGGTPTGGGTGGSVSGGGSSGSAGATGGGTGGAGGVDAGPGTATYTAAIAECIAITDPNPPACEATAGPGLMTIDTQTPIVDGGPGNYATAGYLRFDLDGVIAGKTISAVTLRLRVGSETNSNSTQSGEINAVTCFSLADLSTTAPAKQGAVLSPNQGAVANNEVVNFSLPVGTVTANQPVCLGIYSLNTDGVDYGNAKGANSPQLIIDYQ